MSEEIKNVRLKEDIKKRFNGVEQKLVLGILSEIEQKGDISLDTAKTIGTKAFEESK